LNLKVDPINCSVFACWHLKLRNLHRTLWKLLISDHDSSNVIYGIKKISIKVECFKSNCYRSAKIQSATIKCVTKMPVNLLF